jgi:hypothetical protein
MLANKLIFSYLNDKWCEAWIERVTLVLRIHSKLASVFNP